MEVLEEIFPTGPGELSALGMRVKLLAEFVTNQLSVVLLGWMKLSFTAYLV